jgi:hypothetical protein
MKVVQELVAYFDRRGRLTPEQMAQLLEQGLLATDAPRTMVEHAETVGAVFWFRVTGDKDGIAWGTDVYSGDSQIAVAAVHAGLLAHAETAVLRVTVAAAPSKFNGSLRNGVTTHDFENFPTAFTLERPKLG